jgi:hypothetical protein
MKKLLPFVLCLAAVSASAEWTTIKLPADIDGNVTTVLKNAAEAGPVLLFLCEPWKGKWAVTAFIRWNVIEAGQMYVTWRVDDEKSKTSSWPVLVVRDGTVVINDDKTAKKIRAAARFRAEAYGLGDWDMTGINAALADAGCR